MSTYKRAQEAILATIRELIVLMPRDELANVLAFLVEHRLSERPYFVNSEVTLPSIWDEIRKDEDLVDFISRGTVIFSLEFQIASPKGDDRISEDFKDLHSLLGNAHAQGRLAKNAVTAIDHSFVEKIPADGEALALFRQNRWYIFLTLIDMNLRSVIPLLQQQLKELTNGEANGDARQSP